VIGGVCFLSAGPESDDPPDGGREGGKMARDARGVVTRRDTSPRDSMGELPIAGWQGPGRGEKEEERRSRRRETGREDHDKEHESAREKDVDVRAGLNRSRDRVGRSAVRHAA
jgi:hypothetical protein